MFDINDLKMKIKVVKEEYLKEKNYHNWHKYYMIISACYDLLLLDYSIDNTNIHELLLDNVIYLKNNLFIDIVDIEKEKLNEMELYLKRKLGIKTLKKQTH